MMALQRIDLRHQVHIGAEFTRAPLRASGLGSDTPPGSCIADLGPNGEILFEGKVYKSPSAFSVHVKRKVNPGRKVRAHDKPWVAHRCERDVAAMSPSAKVAAALGGG